MTIVTLADAKAQLSALVERATKGEIVQISRRGKIVAQLAPVQRPHRPVDVAALHALTRGMTPQPVSAGEWMRQMRDEERY